jgi:hypothetical protein
VRATLGKGSSVNADFRDELDKVPDAVGNDRQVGDIARMLVFGSFLVEPRYLDGMSVAKDMEKNVYQTG